MKLFKIQKKILLIIIGASIITGIFGFFTFLGENLTHIGKTDIKMDVKPSLIEEEAIYTYAETYAGAEGKGVRVDADGNVYQVSSYDPAGDEDITINKYNSSLELEWSCIFQYTIVGDKGNDIAIDDANDAVYVAGHFKNSSRGSRNDAFLAKINKTTGEQIWNRTWYNNSQYYYYLYGITLDALGNVYAAGFDEYLSEYFIVKYSGSGDAYWYRSYKPSNDGADRVNMWADLKMDNSNKLVLVAHNLSVLDGDIQVAKFHPENGTQVWNRTLDYDIWDWAYCVDFDNENNIYIGGKSGEYNLEVMLLVKYSADGDLLLNATYFQEEESRAYDLKLDPINNDLFLVGTCRIMNNDQRILCAINPEDGQLKWNRKWDDSSSSTYYEEFKGIAIDFSTGHVYLSGTIDRENSAAGTTIVLQQLSLGLDNFTVSTPGYEDHDTDGNLALNWTTTAPFGADNYTVYNSSQYISEINGSLQANIRETNSTELFLNDLPDGTYYYIVEAHNIWGNSTSDCITINVARQPGMFDLWDNSTNPDGDGIFWLNWSDSTLADSYNIYYDTSPIYDVSIGTVILYASGLTELKAQIDLSLLPNAEYYFVVAANNTHGNYSSTRLSNNNISAVVGILPNSPDVFPRDYGNPDSTGDFTISWDLDIHANDFSVYWSVNTIEITDGIIDNSSSDVFAIEEHFTDNETVITDWPEGTFYFVVIAFNDYGNASSTNLLIRVDFPGSPTEHESGLPWWLVPIVTGIISALVGIAIKQTYSSVKKRRIFRQEVVEKLKKVDNIESFLKEKLEYEEWLKLQEPLKKYKDRQITNKELFKHVKKETGKDFADIFK